MADPVAAYANEHALGRLERRVALKADLEIQPGLQSPAELCLTPRGAWIVAARDEVHGRAIQLSEDGDLVYVPGKREDVLRVGDRALTLAASRREEALEILGLARLRSQGTASFRPVSAARHIEEPSLLERTALEGLLDPTEILLAHLRLESSMRLRSWLGFESSAKFRVVMSDTRIFSLALSPAGDTRLEPIEPQSLRVEGGHVHIGSERVKARRALSDLIELGALGGMERVREAARLNWLDRDDPGRLATARSLLEALARRGDGIAVFVQFVLSAELDEPDAARPSLEGVVATGPRTSLWDVWRRWQLSAKSAQKALSELRALAPHSTTFAFHSELRALLLRQAESPADAASIDVDFADHALLVGQDDVARSVLEERLLALPIRAIDEIAPVSKRAAATVAARARLLELLARARGEGDRLDAGTLASLARLQPLATERWDALLHVAEADLKRRAEDARAAVTGEALRTPVRQSAAIRSLAAFSEMDLSLLRHPSSPEMGDVLGALQSLVARQKVPDLGSVRDYCRAVLRDDDSVVGRAFRDAATLLEVAAEAYVSRGKKDIGIRCWSGSPPFLLIGGRHLDSGDRFALTESELRFLLAAELAHLRFGHQRVTTDEVWSGVLDKGRQGLDVFLGVLPVLKGLHGAGKLGRVASQLDTAQVRRAVESATAINDAITRTVSSAFKERPGLEPAEIAASNERLIAAHRFVQLSADRVGLVVAGDLTSALRAILLARRDYADLLAALEHDALGPLLERRLESGEMAFSDLSVRIAALVSFFLTDDFVHLRARLSRGVGPEST